MIAAVELDVATGHGDVRRRWGRGECESCLPVGDWRVRFALDNAAGVLTVLRVLPRGGAYRE